MGTKIMNSLVHHWLLAAVLAVSIPLSGLLINPYSVFAASTSPGKKSVFESSDFGGTGDIPAGTTLLTGVISQGKKKNVLVIEAMLSSGTDPVASFLSLRVIVNGVSAEPTSFGMNDILTDCSGTPCTLTGSWWLDLDVAELANPGLFINVPLTVTLEGGEGPPSPQFNGRVTMSARLQKK